MSEWKKVRLGEVCDVRDGTHASPKEATSGRLLLTSKNLIGGRLSFEKAYLISNDDADEIDRRSKVDQWDVLFSMIGTVGEIAVVKETPEFAIKNVGLFKTNGNIELAHWVYYYFRSPTGKMQVYERLQGTTQQYITLGQLREFPIPLPPLPTQRKIAAVLSSLDDKIENNRKICANLEAQAQAIFKSWFVDFEPFGGKMPQGWNVCSFDQICKPRNEKGSPQLLNMYAVTNTGILPRAQIFKKDLAFSGTACKIMHKGDLVFGMSRSILNWGVMKDEIGGVSSAYHIYSVTRGIPSNYIESYISAHIREFTTLIKPASREGQGFDADKLMTMELGFPNKEILEAYYDLVEPILQLIAIRKREVYSLSLLRDALLPKLMSGEIDVEKVEVA